MKSYDKWIWIFIGSALTNLCLFFCGKANADMKAVGKAEWTAIGKPSFIKINGVGGKLGCDLKGDKFVTGECKVFMRHWKTGMDLRDDHMHNKYLLTETYEWATLKIDKFEIKDGPQEFSGILTIKKDSAKVKGKITLKGLKGTADFEVNIKDFPSIGVPSYLGITVADKVQVKIELVAK